MQKQDSDAASFKLGMLAAHLGAVQATIDPLLKCLLRSICTYLAGESASGTLWLKNSRDVGCRLRWILRNGRVLSSKEVRLVSFRGLQLLADELPRSGEPACSAGHGIERWRSRELRAFISLPMSLDSSPLGCFVVWLKPSDPIPTPGQIAWAATLADLACAAIHASRPRRQSL
jgi:hypothetical protein